LSESTKRGSSGNSHLPPAKKHVSILAGETDSSHGGCSIASTNRGQNSTLSSLLNDARVADITQSVTSTLCATQRHSIITPTATPGRSSRNTPTPTAITQTDSTHHVVSSPASVIARTPTPLSGLENLPTPIPNPKARTIITNPPRKPAAERNQRLRQCQLQPQAVSTPRSVVSGSRGFHQLGHSDMKRHVFATCMLLELYMWKRRPFISASDLETVCCAMQCVMKALAEAQYW